MARQIDCTVLVSGLQKCQSLHRFWVKWVRLKNETLNKIEECHWKRCKEAREGLRGGEGGQISENS